MNNIYLNAECEMRNAETAGAPVSDPACAELEFGAPSGPAEAGTPNARYRKVNRSPDEEYAARLARVAPLRKFPREVVAAFLFQFKELTVTRNGLAMKIGKERFVFWHEHSQVCAQVGRTFSVGYQLEDLDWVAVFDARGALVEIVPQKIRAPWFDDEALRQATRAVAQANNRIKERFAHLHAPTAEARLNRTLSNAERLQIVNTFPLPARGNSTLSPTLSETQTDEVDGKVGDKVPRFAAAKKLQETADKVRGRRGAHVAQERRVAERLAAEEDDFTALDRGSATRHHEDPYAISMEELNEF